MKQILGYFLGFAIFIVGIPALMWLVAGTYLYFIGILVALWNIWALAVFAAVASLMMLQVRSEEKRLEADFGQEYLEYKKKTGRFITFKSPVNP